MSLLNDEIKLGEVGLRVTDLKQSIDYYQRILGFTLLSQDDSSARLGIAGQSLIYLKQEANLERADRPYTGLYHIAFLLPSEKDLAQILFHFAAVGYQISGAGDHLYSQALYMNDPDGNGIEIYADRPRSQWTINADGTIESGTNAVDIERLVRLVDTPQWQGMPAGTTIGHIHLQVRSIAAVRRLYVDFFGMDVKTIWQGALFLSKNGYHHHLGNNAWAGTDIKELPENKTGMLYYTIIVTNYDKIVEALETGGYAYTSMENAVMFKDANDIWVRISQ